MCWPPNKLIWALNCIVPFYIRQPKASFHSIYLEGGAPGFAALAVVGVVMLPAGEEEAGWSRCWAPLGLPGKTAALDGRLAFCPPCCAWCRRGGTAGCAWWPGKEERGAWSCWGPRSLRRCSRASQQRFTCVSRPVGARGGSKEWCCGVSWGRGSALGPWFLAGPYRREHWWPFCLRPGCSGCGQRLVGCSLRVSLVSSPLLAVLPLGPVSRFVWPLLLFPLKRKSWRSGSGCRLGVFLDNQTRGKLLKQCLDIAYFNSSKLYLQLPVQINVML